MKRLMILGASILQLPAIQRAKALGIETVAVDMNEKAIGFDYADICLPISTIDTENVLKEAKRLKVDGIMTLASDMPMRTVAAVAESMGLAGIDSITAVKATNKIEMRKALAAANVPIPAFCKASDYEEFKNGLKNFSSKVVVKPADNSGSRGVFLLEDISDAEMAEYAYNYSVNNSRNGDVIVEEYMSGPEVSVEGFSVDGEVTIVQITDKLTTGTPCFVEMGHSQPTMLSYETAERIKEVATAAIKAVGIKNGPSHTEIKVTEDGPKIVELGARLGGDCITTHLVPLSTGIDLVECTIRSALGEKPELEKKVERGAAIRYFDSCCGKLISVSGVNEARSLKGIFEIDIVKEIGSDIPDIHSSNDRIGFVIASGADAKTSIDMCNKAKEKIKVVIE